MMMLMIIMLLLIILECAIYLKPFWRFGKIIAALVVIGLPAATAIALLRQPCLMTSLIAYTTLARLFNLFRVIYGRQKPDHLLRSARRASYSIGIIALGLVALLWLGIEIRVTSQLLTIIGSGQYVVALGLLLTTIRNLRASHFTPTEEYLADRDLPSLTVAIPARNETLDLENCLQSVLASDYPKLEVIVLDDNSQDTTPDIIKKFAHDGVRFVKGSEPDNHWLAKNFAYERLLNEASGELILFCGVDVRFRPESLRRLVTAMVTRKKTMVSIMPRRFNDSVAGSFIQPMRYWWELALPRRLFNRPPVLSTCWVIKRSVLQKLGGFAAVSHTVIPESFFARELIKTDDYSFLRSDAYMGIETEKSTAEQRDTAIRMRYPELHKRPELAFGMIFAELLLLISPCVLAIYDFVASEPVAGFLSAITTVLLIATHVIIVAESSPPSLPIAFFNYPIAVFSELILGVTSMYRYEFASVIWKGRKITPARQRTWEVIPKLPDA